MTNLRRASILDGWDHEVIRIIQVVTEETVGGVINHSHWRIVYSRYLPFHSGKFKIKSVCRFEENFKTEAEAFTRAAEVLDEFGPDGLTNFGEGEPAFLDDNERDITEEES